MINQSSKIKIFSVLFALLFSACSNSFKTSQAIEQSESKAAVFEVTPTPFLGKTAKIRGDYLPIKITENLRDSVEQQELPKIWLEFENENCEVLRTELDDKFKENLKSAGEALFRYQYVIHHSENPDERFNASYNQLMVFNNNRYEMSKLEINSPDGKRKLTEDEVLELLYKQSGMINDRYWELDDHFYPKSAFYRFKESVNKKLGYSIF